MNKKNNYLLLGLAAIVLLASGWWLYQDSAGRQAEAPANGIPPHIQALLEGRQDAPYGSYLTLEEVSAEYKRAGKIPGFLDTYLTETGGVRIRIIKIGEDVHVIESIKDPFASLSYGYTNFPEVWLVNLREGTVLMRPDEVVPILKEQWDKVLGAIHDPDDSAGVEATTRLFGQAWDQFNLLTLFGLSPDGKNLGFYLFTRLGGVFDYAAVIGFLNMQTKQPVFTSFTVYSNDPKTWRPRWSPKGSYIYYGWQQTPEWLEGKEVNILHVDSAVTQQRLFSLPSIEMLTILFPEEVRAAKEKYQAPDFGGWLSLDSAIRSNINFRPWIDNIEWSADESSFSFTTITEQAAHDARYLEIRARDRVKEELGRAYWTINADGSGLQLLRTER